MIHGRRYTPVIDDYDIDHEINEEIEKVKNHIKSLKVDYDEIDCRKIMKSIATEYIDNID